MRELTSYLIADILKACNVTELADEETEQTMEQHFKNVENFLSLGFSMQTFSEYCGLESKYFPPAEYFSEEEQQVICYEFEKMMLTWNLAIDNPEKLPLSILYNTLIGILDTKTAIVRHGTIHFDFCSGFAPDCIWKEYCTCLEIWNSDKDQ